MPFEKEICPTEYVDVLSDTEWIRTSKVAELIPCSKQQALNALMALVKVAKSERLIEKRKVNSAGRFKFAYEWRKLKNDKNENKECITESIKIEKPEGNAHTKVTVKILDKELDNGLFKDY